MKLELKHLAPYFPYGFKAYDKSAITGKGYEREIKASNIMVFIDNDINAKPILRPLSDLIKEIECNGNKFTPNNHPRFKIFINEDMDWFIDNCPFFVDYGQVQKLFEWHFDVFGLIDKGLAIDINTLNK